MHRLFVAIRPPRAVRELLLGTMGGVPGARWQDDEQLHLTLRFIGEVDRHRAEDMAAALGAVRAAAFTLSLAGVGRFERRGRTDTLWVGVTPRDGVAALARKVSEVVTRVGLHPETRAFLPHVTMARMARSAPGPVEPWLEHHAGLASASWTVDAFCLFESRLGHDGARYEAVARYPLARSSASAAAPSDTSRQV